jgi:hypothetical protein
MIVARCTVCDAEFTEEQIRGAKGCPACGTKSVPMDPRKDRTIKINEHELRILTIWSSNWAHQHCDAQAKKSLSAILQRLNAQLDGVPLTIGAEVRQIQEAGFDAQLVDGTGKVLIPRKDPAS